MSATLLIRALSWWWADVSLNSFQRIQREGNRKENFHFLGVFLKEKLRQKYHHLQKQPSERKAGLHLAFEVQTAALWGP